MAKIKPAKPVDYVGYEPVMYAVSKARAMAWILDQLAPDGQTNLGHALDQVAKIRTAGCMGVVGDALRSALDEIETEYRKLGTNLLAKEVAATLEPKDGV